jgi:hypothetical protein
MKRQAAKGLLGVVTAADRMRRESSGGSIDHEKVLHFGHDD